MKLDRDRFAYVSYRRQSKVYWTSKKVRLAAGEQVLAANGEPYVRGRCGTRISFQPVGPFLRPGEEAGPE